VGGTDSRADVRDRRWECRQGGRRHRPGRLRGAVEAVRAL